MYKTRQGECWDEAAKKIYGHEKHLDFLMKSNLPHLDRVRFSAGTILNTPELPGQQDELPPWRKSHE